MSEALAFDRSPDTAPEIRLAGSWADVTKALAVYPDANERVRMKVEDLLDALAGVLQRGRSEAGADHERGATVLFHEDRVIVGKHEHTFEPNSQLAWLRARLDRSALAGAEFMADLSAENITAFTRRLLDNFLRKDAEPTFESLWPDLLDGIVLIDRRFEGTFGGFAALGSYAGGHGGASRDDARHFITGLLMHPKVRRRLAAIRDDADLDHDLDGDTEKASVILKEMLEDVPADALKSRDVLIDWVCARLDNMGARSASGTAQQGGKGTRFAKLLHSVSQRHFKREGPNLDRIKAGTFVETKPGGGRARDAAITDDIASLAEEVRQLPATLALQLGDEDEAAGPEQVAVLLHYATNLQRPEDLPGQMELLQALLEDPGPGELAVLRAHVTAENPGDEDALRRTSAVVRVLERADRTHLLRACGALTTDLVVATFPEHMGLFFAALDLDRGDDLRELDEIMERVGGGPFLDASPQLVGQLQGLDRAQVERLLEKPVRCRLPLVRMLLASGNNHAIPLAAVYLRELQLPEAEAFLLHTIRPVALLTPEYLMGLVDLHLQRTSSFALRAPVSDVLCRHIAAVGDADPLDKSRLESIRLLARYPSAGGKRMLASLRRFRFGLWGGTEPPHVRHLARALLKHWQGA